MSGEGKNGTCNCSVVSLHYILFDQIYNNTMLFHHLGALKKVLQRGQHSRIMSSLMLHTYLKIFNQNECMSPLRAVKLFAIGTKSGIVVQYIDPHTVLEGSLACLILPYRCVNDVRRRQNLRQ